jgi:hypothetical protein
MESAEANLVTNAIHEVTLPLEGWTRDYDPLRSSSPHTCGSRKLQREQTQR